MGTAGLTGWRARVGDAVAPPVAAHTPAGRDDVRAAIGFVFFALSALYVVKTLRQVLERR